LTYFKANWISQGSVTTRSGCCGISDDVNYTFTAWYIAERVFENSSVYEAVMTKTYA